MTKSVFASLLLATALAACSASDSGEEITDNPAGGKSDDGTKLPIGTYAYDDLGLIDNDVTFIAEITLKTDGTYHLNLAERLRYTTCMAESTEHGRTECGFEENGTYQLSHSAANPADRTLRITKQGENKSRAYNYAWLDDGRLQLTRDGNDQALIHLDDDAYCAAPADCGLQNLPTCSAAWTCEANTCGCF